MVKNFLGRMYFTGNYGFKNLLAFAPMLDLLTLDNNKTGYQLEYHLNKISNFIQFLHQLRLI